MPTWPATLPTEPIGGSLSIASEPNWAEFKPDVGGPIRRRRYSAARTLYRGTIHLEGAQIETLRSFFEEDCASGTLSFDMYDWWNLTQGSATLVSLQFAEPPEFAHLASIYYRANLVLSKVD